MIDGSDDNHYINDNDEHNDFKIALLIFKPLWLHLICFVLKVSDLAMILTKYQYQKYPSIFYRLIPEQGYFHFVLMSFIINTDMHCNTCSLRLLAPYSHAVLSCFCHWYGHVFFVTSNASVRTVRVDMWITCHFLRTVCMSFHQTLSFLNVMLPWPHVWGQKKYKNNFVCTPCIHIPWVRSGWWKVHQNNEPNGSKKADRNCSGWWSWDHHNRWFLSQK